MNAIIIHGSTPASSPSSAWYRQIADTMTAHDVPAVVADLPMLSRQSLDESLADFAQLGLRYDRHTILIGHSAGTNIVLSLLQRIDVRVSAVYLVAGFCSPILTHEPTLQHEYAWATIRSHAEEFHFLNSFDDPYGCDETQGQVLFDHLGGTLVLTKSGHYSGKTLPLLSRLLVGALESDCRNIF